VLSTTPQDHLIIWYETIPSIDCACHPNLLFYNSIVFLDIPSIIETCLHFFLYRLYGGKNTQSSHIY
jgi:hypothetical protein